MADLKSLKINGVSIMDIIYPVGSIYETMDSGFNPAESFGGVWERIKGRVLIGVDEDDTDFTSEGLTGGEKTHKLILSEIPSHSHQQYVTANSGGTGIRKDYNQDVSGLQKYDQGITTGNAGGGGLTTISNLILLVTFGRELLKRRFSKFSFCMEGGLL